LEGVPCLFGRYPTQKIPVGIHLVPTGSGRNLWGTVKTSVFGGYGIPNPYPYPRETRDIPYVCLQTTDFLAPTW